MNLKNLFEANYISVPEEKFDIVEGVQAELAEVQERLRRCVGRKHSS